MRVEKEVGLSVHTILRFEKSKAREFIDAEINHDPDAFWEEIMERRLNAYASNDEELVDTLCAKLSQMSSIDLEPYITEVYIDDATFDCYEDEDTLIYLFPFELKIDELCEKLINQKLVL